MNKNRLPCVTIGLPVYNEEKHIENTLQDIMDQDYPDIKVIIGDNYSDDRTQEICQKFTKDYDNISYFRNSQNLGGVKNIRKILEKVDTKYFALLSGNNRIEACYISKCMGRLIANPMAVISYSRLKFIDLEGNVIPIDYTGYDNPDMTGLSVSERVNVVLNRMGWYFFYCVGKTELFKNVYLLKLGQLPFGTYGADVLVNLLTVLEGDIERVDEVLYYYRRKYNSHEAQWKKALGNEYTLSFPNAELSFNMLRIIRNSDKLKNNEKIDILKNMYKIFLSKMWIYRLNLNVEVDYLDIKKLSQKRNRLLNMVQERPSSLFLREKRLPESPKRPRVAIFEFNDYHIETIPSIVEVLHEHGYAVEVFLINEQTYQTGLFSCYPNLPCDIHVIKDKDGTHERFTYWLNAFRLIEYEFIIINSLEPAGILDIAFQLPGRHYSFLHNPSMVMKIEKWQEYFRNPLHKPLLLHPMSGSMVPQLRSVPFIPPYLKPERFHAAGKNPNAIRFIVQGGIENRRNYNLLVNTIASLRNLGNKIPAFEVLIIGRYKGEFTDQLKQIVHDQNWTSFVFIYDENKDYPDFFGELAAANYILPLLDYSSETYKRYFQDKLTSSISMAFALGIPPILHTDLAAIYGITGITYGNNPKGLLTSMIYAMRISPEEYAEMCSMVDKERKEFLELSKVATKAWFAVDGYKKAQYNYTEKIPNSEAGAQSFWNISISEDNARREEYYHTEAIRCLKAGDADSAISFGCKMVELKGENTALAYDILGTALRLKGKNKEAIEWLIKAYQKKPSESLKDDIKNVLGLLNDSRLAEWQGDAK